MMRSTVCVLAALILLSTLAPSADAQRRRRDDGIGWAPDGVHLLMGGKWIEPHTGEEVEAVATPAEADAREALGASFGPALGAAAPGVLRGTRSFSTLPRAPEAEPGMRATDDGLIGAVVFKNDLWVSRGGAARKVAEGLNGVRRFEIAPDGSAVSYIEDFNLFITRTDDGRTHALSEDGGENLFYGELDWVYQEEVYGRGDFKATWWSPDGKHLAFFRIDEHGVDTFTVVDHIPNQLGLEHLKYPKAGTTNPRATLHVANSESGEVTSIDLSSYDPKDEILLVRVTWTPEGDRVVFMVQNREQTWLDLVFADPATGVAKTVIHEEMKGGWVNVLAQPRWLADGTFVWESERSGFKHHYRYDRAGKLLAAVTDGDWEVRSVIDLNEKAGHVTFYGTKDGAVGQNAYRVGLDGKGLTRITKGRGTHRIELNGDGTLLIDTFSSLENPGETWLRRADGTDVRRLDQRTAANANHAVLHQIKARDGETLDVTVERPADFDSTRKYPIWIDTYSGPDAPSIRDSWDPNPGNLWVDNGIVLLRVNVRSASGRGMRYTTTCYRQFGVQELKDLEDAINWIGAENTWADLTRVGISGWSYGGFMAAYALTHSKMFKCGIAGAGVYDWRLYDTIYTERYMATPQNNPDGYRISSVVEAAKDLHGELLIVHGTMDDNVHMQNALQFVHALQDANKQNFTFMLYPKSRHGVGSRHLGELRQRFIRENL